MLSEFHSGLQTIQLAALNSNDVKYLGLTNVLETTFQCQRQSVDQVLCHQLNTTIFSVGYFA